MFDFRKKDKGGVDTLTDIKTVTRWLEGLSVEELPLAHEDIVNKLIQYNRETHPVTPERLRALMELDDQSRELNAGLRERYIRGADLAKAMEARYWTSLHAYAWELMRAYHGVVQQLARHPQADSQAMLPRLTARAIRHTSDVIRWRHARYQDAEGKIWQHLNKLYLFAEANGFKDERFLIHRDDTQPKSCADIYLHALLLSLLADGSMSARHIDRVDQWLFNWDLETGIDEEFDPERHAFFVNPESNRGPQPLGDSRPPAGMLYFDTHPLLARIRQIKAALRGGAIPATLGLGEHFRLPDGYDMLDRASKAWSPGGGRERRRENRRIRRASWRVVHDLEPIIQAIEASRPPDTGDARAALCKEELLDINLYGYVTERTKARLRQLQESAVKPPPPLDLGNLASWEQLDQSPHGIGFVASDANAQWVKHGQLLGLVGNPDNPRWEIGMVRRIIANKPGHRFIGVSLIFGQVECVILEKAEMQGLGVGAVARIEKDAPRALLLRPVNGNPQLILQPAHYVPGKPYRLRLPDRNIQPMELLGIREKGDTWLLCDIRFSTT